MNGKIGLKIPLSQNRENEMRASNNQLDLDDMDDLDQMVDDILGNGTGIEQPIKNKNNSYNIRSINKQLESPQINKTPPNSKKTITNTPGSMRHNSKMDSINFAIMNNSINQAKIIDYMGVSVKRQIDNQYLLYFITSTTPEPFRTHQVTDQINPNQKLQRHLEALIIYFEFKA